MSRILVPLTVDLLAALDLRADGPGGGEPMAETEAWVSELLRDWGSCGRVLLVDGRPRGCICYAPADLVPGAGGFATAPVSADAVLLVAAWVAPEARGGGGRRLIQAMAADLVVREFRAVEAFAVRGTDRREAAPRHGLVHPLPAEFLARVGFKTQRAHRRTPRMRMDLRQTVSWRSEVEAAWERLVGVVRPAARPAPVPAPRLAPSPRP